MNPRDYTKLTETLRSILMTRIQAGSLVLPTLPKVSQELQQLLDDQKVDQTKLTKLVENDPVLVANVMRVANDQMHRRSGKMGERQQSDCAPWHSRPQEYSDGACRPANLCFA